MRLLPTVLVVGLLAVGCTGKSSPVKGAEPPIPDGTERELIEGAAEKGPFVDGSVTIAPATGGESVVTTVQDGLGRFAAWVPAAPVYRLEVVGRAYREGSGDIGESPVTLRGLHVGKGPIRVNVLTHLAHDRALRLAEGGTSLPDAIDRAEGEVHRALGLAGSFYTPSRAASSYAAIGADDPDHAYLLAASAMIDVAAANDLPGFLSALAFGLAEDGELSAEQAALLADARRALDPEPIADSLRRWLDRTGHGELIVPNLRRVLDSDGDGIPDADERFVVDASRLAIVRYGLERADEAVGGAGAVETGCPPAEVALFDHADARLPLASGVVATDGSFALPFGTQKISRPRLFVEATDACGLRSERVAIVTGIDETAPVLDPTAFVIVRRGRGEVDGVIGAAGAAIDRDGAVAELWFSDAPDGARLALARPTVDGGFAEVAIGADGLSLRRLWAEAVDKAGNVSPRIEIEQGSALGPPVVAPGAVVVARTGLGEVDTVTGLQGAVTGVCAPVEVALFDGKDSGSALVVLEPLHEGGFGPAPLGDATWTPAEVWLEATDKCGVRGPRVEVLSARDHEAPVVDPELLVFHASEDGQAISGLPGAISDPAGRIGYLVYVRQGAGSYPIAVGELTPDAGGFEPIQLASHLVPDDAFCFEARDKAGNSSAPVHSRRVHARLDYRSSGHASLPELSIFSGSLDVDPRTVSPGYLAWGQPRLAPTETVEPLSPLVASAAPETRELPVGWRWIDLSIPAPDVAVAAGASGDPSVVRTMGDWPWLVTLRRRCEDASCASWSWDVVDRHGPGRREGMAMAPQAFGGHLAYGGVSNSGPMTDTWRLSNEDLAEPWVPVSTVGPAASFARMVLDTARGVNVLVAAVEGDPGLQLWEWGGTAWTRVPGNGGPSYRTGFAVAFDELRRQLVLFGGRDASGASLNDTWLWNGTAWSSPVLGISPTARWGHGMAWWGTRGAVYLQGGSSAPVLDTWAWNGTAWTHVRSGAPGTAVGTTLMADPDADRLFAFHTHEAPEGPTFGINVSTGLVTAQLETFWLPPGFLRSLAWNPMLGEVTAQLGVGFGGYGAVWRGGWWKGEVGPDFVAPAWTLVIDTHRRLRIEAGGNAQPVAATAERGPSLERLVITSPGWPAGVTPAYVFDAMGARTVGVGGGQSWALGEVDFGNHEQLYTTLAGAPPGEVELVFDPVRGLVVAYDGVGTWELDGDAWSHVAAAPAACPGGTLVFDALIGKVRKLPGGGCALECSYDGSWSCGGAQIPEELDLIGAPLGSGGELIAHGNASLVWLREGVTPHRRHAVQGFAVQLFDGMAPLAVRVTAASIGSGFDPATGSAIYGFELQAWSWSAAEWIRVGTANAPGPTEQLLEVTLDATELTPFVRSGGLRFQLVPFGPSAESRSAAQLVTSRLDVEVEYLLPPPR